MSSPTVDTIWQEIRMLKTRLCDCCGDGSGGGSRNGTLQDAYNADPTSYPNILAIDRFGIEIADSNSKNETALVMDAVNAEAGFRVVNNGSSGSFFRSLKADIEGLSFQFDGDKYYFPALAPTNADQIIISSYNQNQDAVSQWVDIASIVPTPTTPDLQAVTGVGSTTNLKINALNYDATANDIVTKGGVRFLYGDSILTSANMGIGTGVLAALTTGTSNIAIGNSTNAPLKNLTTGGSNIAIGGGSSLGIVNATFNVGVGTNTLKANVSGGSNTAVGASALSATTAAKENVAIGGSAMFKTTSGDKQTAVGFAAMINNLTGIENTALAHNALQFMTAGNYNTAVGKSAGSNISTGSWNVAIGYFSQFNGNSTPGGTGNYNILIGANSGTNIFAGNNNIVIGANTNPATDASNQLVIGDYMNSSDDIVLNINKNVNLGTHNLYTASTGKIYVDNNSTSAVTQTSITASTDPNWVVTANLDNRNGLTLQYGNVDGGGGIRKYSTQSGGNEGILEIFEDTPTSGAYTGQAVVKVTTAGTEKMRIDQTGQLKLNNYATGTTFTGTAAFGLGVDTIGNVVATSGGGGSTPGWQAVLDAGSSISHDNTVAMNGNNLIFSNSGHTSYTTIAEGIMNTSSGSESCNIEGSTISMTGTQPQIAFEADEVSGATTNINIQRRLLNFSYDSGDGITNAISFNVSPTGVAKISISKGGVMNFEVDANGVVSMPAVKNSASYANDAAAASGGVAISSIYRNGSALQIRVT